MPGKLIVGTIETQNIKFDSDTTGLTIASTGDVTASSNLIKTGNPCFRLSGVAGYDGGAGGAYTPPIGNSAPHNFSRTDFDVGNCIATSGTTAHTRFVAPVAGKYYFHSLFQIGGISANTEARYVTTYYKVSGNLYSYGMQYVRDQDDGWGSGNAYASLVHQDIVDMAKDEYFEVAIGRSSSSDLSANIYDDGTNTKGDGKNSRLIGYLVG